MSKTRVLIVEDDALLVKSLERKLKTMGYDIPAVASNGEAAIAKTAELHPDLILMDIRLEGEIDGIEAAKRIHAIKDVPIIYLTAFGDEETLDRAKVTEPFGYILKPFNEKELLIAIETSLYKHHLQKKSKEREHDAMISLERQLEECTRELRETSARLKVEIEARKKAEAELKACLEKTSVKKASGGKG